MKFFKELFSKDNLGTIFITFLACGLAIMFFVPIVNKVKSFFTKAPATTASGS